MRTPGRTFPSASMPASGPRYAYLMVASPPEHPRPAAGPSRRPRPTGRCRHSAHGTPAAHCRRRFAHRSGHSRSTAPAVLLMVPVAFCPTPIAPKTQNPRPHPRRPGTGPTSAPGGDTARASPGYCWASPAGPAELGYLAQPAWRSWATAAGPLGLGAWGRWRLRGKWAQFLPSGCSFCFVFESCSAMPPKKGPKAPGGLTLTRAIGPQDIKLLNKLTSDPVGVGIFSSIGLTSCQ